MSRPPQSPRAIFKPVFRRALILLTALAALAGGPGRARAQAVPARTASLPITNLEELWSQPAESGAERPLRMRAAVLYCDPEWRGIFLAVEKKVAYFVGPTGSAMPFQAGQVVELAGFIRADKRSIIWERTAVTVLPDAPFPAASPVTPESGEVDFEQRLIEIGGLVGGQQEVDATHLRFDLIAFGRSFMATRHLRAGEPVPQLRGACVRLHGVSTVKRDADDRIAENTLWVTTPAQVKITGWLGEDARFVRAPTALEHLATSPADELVRVVGTVHSQEAGKSLTLRDATGQVKLLTLQSQPMKVGDRVEAVGLPAVPGPAGRFPSRGRSPSSRR